MQLKQKGAMWLPFVSDIAIRPVGIRRQPSHRPSLLSAPHPLRAPAQLSLKTHNLRPLDVDQQHGQLPSRRLHERQPLPLQEECLIEQLADPALVCTVAGEYLLSEIPTHIALPRKKRNPLLPELPLR